MLVAKSFMTRILIRCDASSLIGSGHVIRCRTLARELQRRGAEVLFLCRQQPGDLIALLEQEFHVLPLPELSLAACENLEGRLLYQSWLGCSQERDAEESLTVLASAGIKRTDWLVVDHYGLDSIWESQLTRALEGDTAVKLLVIDDLADRPHQANLLLDQNYFNLASYQRYKELVNSECRQLLGPHYALLGPEYHYLHKIMPIRESLKRVFVYFGAVDNDSITETVLKALSVPPLDQLAVDVIVGAYCSNRKAVEELARNRPFTTLYDFVPSLAGLLSRADLAIGAGGSTTWERICLGVPSILICTAENQNATIDSLVNDNFVQAWNEKIPINSKEIHKLLSLRLKSKMHSDAARHLCDGWGTSRVATALIGPCKSIKLRLAEEADENLLLTWANDIDVRKNSFHTETIDAHEHHLWFSLGIKNINRLHFIILDAVENCPLGQIRFDRNLDSNIVYIDISLDRAARGHGLASSAIKIGITMLRKKWPESDVLIAEILSHNIASIKSFKKAGFIKTQTRQLSPSFVSLSMDLNSNS